MLKYLAKYFAPSHYDRKSTKNTLNTIWQQENKVELTGLALVKLIAKNKQHYFGKNCRTMEEQTCRNAGMSNMKTMPSNAEHIITISADNTIKYARK